MYARPVCFAHPRARAVAVAGRAEQDNLHAARFAFGPDATRAESAICLCLSAHHTTGTLTLRSRLSISWASAAGSTSSSLLMCIATLGACVAGGIASFRCLWMRPYMEGGTHFGSPS
jgi:hypothetical protein